MIKWAYLNLPDCDLRLVLIKTAAGVWVDLQYIMRMLAMVARETDLLIAGLKTVARVDTDKRGQAGLLDLPQGVSKGKRRVGTNLVQTLVVARWDQAGQETEECGYELDKLVSPKQEGGGTNLC